MRCFFCQAPLNVESKVSFRETCPSCVRDVHICFNCAYHDKSSFNECRESQAERVIDKDRANYCEYFVLTDKKDDGARVDPELLAKQKLEELFKKK